MITMATLRLSLQFVLLEHLVSIYQGVNVELVQKTDDDDAWPTSSDMHHIILGCLESVKWNGTLEWNTGINNLMPKILLSHYCYLTYHACMLCMY